jgi:hypothetical protein
MAVDLMVNLRIGNWNCVLITLSFLAGYDGCLRDRSNSPPAQITPSTGWQPVVLSSVSPRDDGESSGIFFSSAETFRSTLVNLQLGRVASEARPRFRLRMFPV